MFEGTTISIIYLLSCLFSKVSVTKPSASKGGNSEVYVVCEHFKRSLVTEDIWKMLLDLVENQSAFLISEEFLPNEFRESVQRCSIYFSNSQIDVIHRNLKLWNLKSNPNDYTLAVKDMQILQANFTKSYLEKYHLNLMYEDSIPDTQVYRSLNFWGQVSRCCRNRDHFSGMSTNFSLPLIQKLLKKCEDRQIELSIVETLEEDMFDYCKPFKFITNSKFVHKDLLEPFVMHTQLEKCDSEHGWCKNVCLEGCACKCSGSISAYFDSVREMISLRQQECEQDSQCSMFLTDVQLLTREQIGNFVILASCFETVFFYPPTGEIEFFGLRGSWKDTWKRFFEAETSHPVYQRRRCVRVDDVCQGTFLEDAASIGESILFEALTSYNECYVLRYLKNVAR